jgi:hypothetical protein
MDTMSTESHDRHHGDATPTSGRHRRRAIAVTAAAIAVGVAAAPLATADSPSDDGHEQIAFGSTWS